MLHTITSDSDPIHRAPRRGAPGSRTKRLLPLLAIVHLLIVALPCAAQEGDADPLSIDRVLKPDGTLDMSTGFRGSLDARGWKVDMEPDGTPRFSKDDAPVPLAAHPDDAYWDERFGLGGSSGPIYTIAIAGCNDVYIGGRFTWLANIPANNIARWDGREWSTLGDGVTAGSRAAEVRTIAVGGNDIYVGGTFDSAGTVAARNIARWDGSTWSPLAGGVGQTPADTVLALAVDGNIVYAGGRFSRAGAISVSAVASWDRTSGLWSPLAGGITSTVARVHALALYGSDLFIGGIFQAAGTLNVQNLIRYHVAGNFFTDVGGGVASSAPEGGIYALAVNGDDLYVGGLFDKAGEVEARNIARWEIDTRTWKTLGSGLDGLVRAIEVSGTKIYVGGEFVGTSSADLQRVARWDGSRWTALGTTSVVGVNNTVFDIAVSGRDIYVAGLFNRAGTLIAFGAAHWDIGTRTWHSLNIDAGNGINGPVYAIAVNGADVYVGGRFTAVGGIRVGSVARWNSITASWSSMGGGAGLKNPSSVSPLPTVYAIAVEGKDVYIGGRFDKAGVVDANNVAHWRNGVWSPMREGIGYNYQGGSYDSTSIVSAIAVRGTDVFVGGQFDQAGGVRANRISRWDAALRQWSPMGGGLGGSSFYTYVSAIAVRDSNVYVGGVFPIAGDIDVKNVARWDGSKWNRLGNQGGNNGVNNSVSALVIGKDGEVYVGGDFKVAGGSLSVSNIAMWNGQRWSNVGGGVNGTVYALSRANDGIYAGGKFQTAGSQARASLIARWDGTKWYELGSGVEEFNRNGEVRAIGSNGINVYAGGEFSLAGKKPSYNFAHWTKLAPGIIRDVKPDDAQQGPTPENDTPRLR